MFQKKTFKFLEVSKKVLKFCCIKFQHHNLLKKVYKRKFFFLGLIMAFPTPHIGNNTIKKLKTRQLSCQKLGPQKGAGLTAMNVLKSNQSAFSKFYSKKETDKNYGGKLQ